MGKWPDFEYHVGKCLKYDRFGSNSSHPSLALDGLVHGTHFLWSYLVISDIPENGQKVPAQLGLWVYNSENRFVG